MRVIHGVAACLLAAGWLGCRAQKEPPMASSVAPTAATDGAARVLGPPAANPLAPRDASFTSSGLASKVLKPGTGDRMRPRDYAWVRYTAWDKSGKEIGSSSGAAGQSLWQPENLIVKGLGEGLALMTKGEKRRLWIPASLAYGEETPVETAAAKKSQGDAHRKNAAPKAKTTGDNKPKGPLIYDVEVLDLYPEPPQLVPALEKLGVRAYRHDLPYAGGGTFARSLVMEPASAPCEDGIDFKLIDIQFDGRTGTLSALTELILKPGAKVCLHDVKFTARDPGGALLVHGPVFAERKPFDTVPGLKVFPDGWGARGVTVKPAAGEPLEFAGLSVPEQMTLSVSRDGVVIVDREGVRARDHEGFSYSTRRVTVDGSSLIVFVRDRV